MARDLEAEQLKDLAYQRGIQEGRRQMADCNADLLAALRALEARTETRIDYCFCETAKAIDGDLPCLFCLKQQARAAIERAEGK